MTAKKNPKVLSAMHRSDNDFLLMNLPGDAEARKAVTLNECRFLLKLIHDLLTRRLEDDEVARG